MLSNKTPLRHRYAMPPLPKERLSCILRTNSKLVKLWIVWYTRLEKTKSFRKPLLTPQSVGVVFFLLRTIQNLQSYGLCGILDIEKDNRPQGGLPSRLRKIRSELAKVRGRFFFLLSTNSKLAKLWIVWYIRHRKRQPPTRWIAEFC